MAVPTSGNFEMFGTGSNTTIAGAIVEGGGNVDSLDTFTLLRAASNPDLFDETYSGVVTNAINHVSASQQYRNYPQRFYYMFVRECTDGARETDGVLGDMVVKSLTDITSWTHMLIPRFPGDTAAYFEVYGTATRAEYDANAGDYDSINLDTIAGVLQKSDCNFTPTPTPTDTPTPTPTDTNTPTPTPVTYYYQLSHCTDGPSNSIYVYSVGTQITNGDSFSYFSNCYEYYDVDLGQTGTIDLAGLSTCVCATPTPTPTSTNTPTPTPTDTNTPTPTPTPVTYYYQLAHCNDGPSNSIYVFSVGTQITNGDSFSYFSNCYEYYDVDLGQTGTIDLAGLSTCVCATPTPTPTNTNTPVPNTDTPTPTPTPVTYYYQLAHCNDGPSNSIYVFSVGTQITNGDAFSYFSNCYEYYDVDPGQTGTINLAGLSTCVCATPTPTPTNTNTPTPTPTPVPGCFTYSIQNNDLSQNLTFQYKTCEGTWVYDNVVLADSGTPDFCAEEGSVSRQSGTFSWVLTTEATTCTVATPTPTPTSTNTPTPTPTPACPSETLGDGATSNDACNDFTAGTGTVRYMDGPFAFATIIYRTSSCGPLVASAGYYSDGTLWRYWNGSAFTTDGVCPNY